MRRFVISCLLGAACGRAARTQPAAAPPPPAAVHVDVGATIAQADAAYAAHDYPTCAAAYAMVAAHAAGERRVNALYNAACCHALGAQPDPGFALLERAVAAGLRDVAALDADGDLANLRADPRWAGFVARTSAAVAAWERSLGDPALRRELLALVVDDQAARAAMIARGDAAAQDAVQAIDRRTTARLQAVVAAHGWPGRSLVGDDGAHAAWLLVQHADLAPAFQAACLALMAPLVASGEVAAIDVAYLDDRVAVAAGRPQRYGTQFGPDREPMPMLDPDHVDARRAAVGLPPLAEYRAEMLRVYGPPAPVTDR